MKFHFKTIPLIFIFSFILGIILTGRGTLSWDTNETTTFSYLLVRRFWDFASFSSFNATHSGLSWYGCLFFFFSGIFQHLFFFLKDPANIHLALLFTLLPLTCYILYHLLRSAKLSPLTSLLAVVFLLCNIRFVGDSVINDRDFPFACAYLLVTVHLFNRLMKGKTCTREIFTDSFIFLIPFLLRPPVGLHFAVYFIYLIKNFIQKNNRWVQALIPLTVLVISLLFFSPKFLELGPRYFLESLSLFSKFSLVTIIPVRFFEQTYPSDQLPFWYTLIWPAVSVTTLFPFLLPLGCLFFKKNVFKSNIKIISWLVLFCLLPAALIMLIKPILYDEDRHVLFVFICLLPAVAIFFDFLSSKIKWVFIIALLMSITFDLFFWGKYSFVFKNPIIVSERSAHSFMRDYWGVCYNDATIELKKYAKDGDSVLVSGPVDVTILQSKRLQTSLLWKDTVYPKISWVPYDPKRKSNLPKLVLATYPYGYMDAVLDSKNGKCEILWAGTLPTGEVACLLTRY